jgi:hypothetical protein
VCVGIIGAHITCCRALRTQQFLEFTAADLAAREAKQRALWAAFEASRRGKVVSKAELDEFYARLQVNYQMTGAPVSKVSSVPTVLMQPSCHSTEHNCNLLLLHQAATYESDTATGIQSGLAASAMTT